VAGGARDPGAVPNFRRAFVPGASYFFTVATADRAEILTGEVARSCLRRAMQEARVRWPFRTLALVLLPDHLHAIWILPPGDSDYSRRWVWIKRAFTREYLDRGGSERAVSTAKRLGRRQGVWQRRFWEHVIRSEDDLAAHCDYIHFNPVKHGLARCPRDWPYSSFPRFVAAGDYGPDWGCGSLPPPHLARLGPTVPE
jgi:putative transposase